MISRHIATEQITIGSSAKHLDANAAGTYFTTKNRKYIRYGDIQVQDDQVYVTFDGSTTPSSSAGEIWNPGDIKRVWGMQNLLDIQFIRVTGDAVLECNYWGE